MCPKSSRSAIISEILHRIEILRALFTLQLLILSTRTHFQRVSEHYMVTRTFLSILTLEREVQHQEVPSTIVWMEYGPTQGFTCAFGEGYTMVALLPTGLG